MDKIFIANNSQGKINILRKSFSFFNQLAFDKQWIFILLFSFLLFNSIDLSATYIPVYTVNTNGGLSFTGNTLGLNKAPGQNQPGNSGSIGAFITTDTSSKVGNYPAGTTLNWASNLSTAVLDIPSNSTILHAELIWSGSFGFDPAITLTTVNNPITFITPDAVSHTITPNPSTAQFRYNTNSTTAGFYVRSADVTSLVAPLGAGTYTTGGVPATVIATENNLNCAGWTLAIAYSNTQMLTSNLTIFTACEASGANAALVSGFHAPNVGNITSVLFSSCLEGDPQLTGDHFLIGNTSSLTYPANAISGPNNPPGNFFGSQLNTVLSQIIDTVTGKLVNNGSATLDTRGSFGYSNSNIINGTAASGARQGYDITAIDVGSLIANNQTQFYAQGTTNQDVYTVNSLGVQIQVLAPVIQSKLEVNQTTITLNSVVTYTSTFTNNGEATANSLVFTDTLPSGLTFVPNSLSVNGTNVPNADIVNGIQLGNLEVNQSVVVVFQATVSQFNPPNSFDNASMVTYTFIPLNSTAPTVGLDSQTNTVTISGPFVAPPVANADTATIGANNILSGLNVLTNDTGTNISVTSYDMNSIQGGTVVIQSNGLYSYNPPVGFSGNDTFNYTITDSLGQTSTATVTIMVLPIAVGDTASIAANTVLNQTNSVLLNDIGSNLIISSFDNSSAKNGTVSVQQNGTYTYTPPNNFSGIDTFNYVATDSSGNHTTGVVTIRVLPIAENNTGTTPVNSPLNGSTNIVGTNLTLISYDHTSSQNGQVTMNANGTYTYTPFLNFSGIDSFNYIFQDGSGNQLTGTVTITVLPIAVNDSGSTVANVSLNQTISVLNNDLGTELTIQTYDANSIQDGTVLMQTNGTYIYTPPLNFSGNDSFNYTATDATPSLTTAKVILTVYPVANNDSASTLANTTLVGSSVLNNDTGTNLTIQNLQVTSDYGVIVTLNSNGTYTYTPPLNFSGNDSFTYTAVDFYGNSVQADVNILVKPVASDENYSTNANTTLSIDVLAEDAGTDLTVTSTSIPMHGSVTISSDSTLNYTPANNFSGPDSFTYTIQDASGNSASATVNITVFPVAKDGNYSTNANTALSIDVLAADAGTGLTVTSTSTPMHGTVTISSDSNLNYIPANNFSGPDFFTYTIQDASGNSASATVNITVLPIANDENYSTNANTALSIDVLAGDAGTGLTVISTSTPQHGTVTILSDSILNYIPANNFSGPDSFTYTIQDASGDTTSATVNITVFPVAKNGNYSTNANTALSIDVLAGDAGTGLTVTSTSTPMHGSVTILSGSTLNYIPAHNFSGSDSFTYTIQDASGNSASATVNITVFPVANNENYSTNANTALSIDVLGGDAGTVLIVISTSTPMHGSVAILSDSILNYTPANNFSGPDSFTYTIQDASGNSASATVNITVSPVANNENYSTNANTTLSIDVLAGDAGTGLIVTSTSIPMHGTVTISSDSNLNYIPANNFSGPDSFTYTIQDASGQTTSATVNITVLPIANDENYFTNANTALLIDVLGADAGTGLIVTSTSTPMHGTVSISSDSTLNYIPANNFSGPDSFTYNIKDASGNSASATVNITVSPVANNENYSTNANTALSGNVLTGDIGTDLNVISNSSPTQGNVTISNDGTFTYTPVNNFSGPDSFTYIIQDASGQTTSATVNITVFPVANDENYSTYVDIPLSGNVLTGDAGTILTVIGHSSPQHGTVTILNDGTFTYTPANNFSGTDSFTYTIQDASEHTTSATVNIRVFLSNPENYSTNANTHLSGNVLTGAGSGLTVTSHSSPQHGNVTISSDGTFIYTPANNFSGPDSFTYTIQDTNGNTSLALVNITVLPIANPENYSINANNTLSANVLTGDIGSGLTVISHSPPGHGTVTISTDGTLIYIPSNNFSGPDSFTYTIQDASGNTALTTVNIMVLPVANPENYSTYVNTPLSSNVLNGDAGTGLIGVPQQKITTQGGNVIISGDGTFTYTPPLNFTGTDSFTYIIQDASGNTASSVVTILVQPHANNTNYSTSANTPVVGNVLNGDVGTGLTVIPQQQTTNQNGNVIISGDGTFTYNPPTNFSGTDSFNYTIIDQSGNRAIGTVSIIVSPVAVNDTGETSENIRLKGSSVLINDKGSDLTIKTYTPTSTAGGKVVMNLQTGTYIYNPPEGFTGTDTFSYTIVDAEGLTSTATVTIIVISIAPPSNFKGSVEKITFLDKNEYKLKASWKASTSPNIVAYRIYYKNRLVKEIPANKKLVFETCLSSRKSANKYSVTAVNSGKVESNHINIKVN